MKATDTYQRFAKFYDQYVRGFSLDLPLYSHFCQPGHRILEIGCGTGRVLQRLAKDGCTVFGVDISDAMLEIAQSNLKEYIDCGQIHLENFNFLDGHLSQKFDRVLITFYTLNYLLDIESCATFLDNVKKNNESQKRFTHGSLLPAPASKTRNRRRLVSTNSDS